MDHHGLTETSGEVGIPKKKNTVMIVLISLLVMSGLINLLFFVSMIALFSLASEVSPDGLSEVVVEGEFETEGKILLLRINGVISRSGFSQKEPNVVSYVRKRLKRVKEENGFSGILLSVNSPGGGISESDEIHTLLEEFKKDTGLPIVAYFDGLAASGGYYISAGCDEIVCQPTAITGSIGVIMQLFHVDGLMGKAGVSTNVIISERTPFKDTGSPFRKMRDDERAKLMEMVNQMYDRFVDVVTQGRTGLNRDQVGDLATGMIYTGTDALKLKLVDSLGYFESAVSRIRDLAGIPDAKIVELRSPLGLLESLIQGTTGKNKFDIHLFPLQQFLQSNNGQPMYLWMPGHGN